MAMRFTLSRRELSGWANVMTEVEAMKVGGYANSQRLSNRKCLRSPEPGKYSGSVGARTSCFDTRIRTAGHECLLKFSHMRIVALFSYEQVSWRVAKGVFLSIFPYKEDRYV